MQIIMDLSYSIIAELFRSPFFQTLIGALTGAWAAFHFQDTKEKRKIIQEEKNLLNYCLMSFGANLETLINIKAQSILPAIDEIAIIRSIPEVQEFLTTGRFSSQPPVIRLDRLAKLEACPTFLKLPNLEKLSSLANKHSNLIRYSHRINESLTNLKNTTEILNINLHRLIDASPQMPPQLLSLIISLHEKLAMEIDDAMFFISKTKEIIYTVWEESFEEGIKGSYKISVLEEKLRYLPPEDHLKGF